MLMDQFTRYLPLQLIKTSFSVTNSYVLRKLRLILFPWRHKPWARQIRRSAENGSMEGWQPPRDDINAPDLYIPSESNVCPGRSSRLSWEVALTRSYGARHLYSALRTSIWSAGSIPSRDPRRVILEGPRRRNHRVLHYQTWMLFVGCARWRSQRSRIDWLWRVQIRRVSSRFGGCQ